MFRSEMPFTIFTGFVAISSADLGEVHKRQRSEKDYYYLYYDYCF